LLPAVVHAEKRYINDLLEITLRTGQGIDHKIIEIVKSGQMVEVIKPGDQWTKIRRLNGTEGWVVSRFLTSNKPNIILLKELQEKHEAIMIRTDSQLEEIAKLQEDNKELRSKLTVSAKTLNDLNNSYETLKKESGEFLQFKSNYNKATAQLTKQKQKIQKYEDELSKLEQRQIFRWIFTGAGILFLGFLIGLSGKRQRRRLSLI
ncbi:MAG: TIGR04211 family SH3 domain-containing protein, partial [Desulfobulbaceae bacterium]|nr:TIGR04211 family SH3 domain-containing protein [Desulfobulbaceae bacterium]